MTTDITALIAQAVAEGRALQAQHDAEIEAAVAARQTAEREQRAREWAETLALIKAELPEWVRPFVIAPDVEIRRWNGYEHEYEYAPARVCLPDLAPIDAYADLAFGHYVDDNRGVGLVVRTPYTEVNDDGETVLSWRTEQYYRTPSDTGGAIPARDWPRAIAQAADEWRRGEELLEQARERPDTGRPPSPTPAPTALERLAEALGDLIDERGWCVGGEE